MELWPEDVQKSMGSKFRIKATSTNSVAVRQNSFKNHPVKKRQTRQSQWSLRPSRWGIGAGRDMSKPGIWGIGLNLIPGFENAF